MTVWMYVTAAAVVLLPLVLIAAFHGADVADSRGRRVSSRWRRG